MASSLFLSTPCRLEIPFVYSPSVRYTQWHFHNLRPTQGFVIPNSISMTNNFLNYQHTGNKSLQPERYCSLQVLTLWSKNLLSTDCFVLNFKTALTTQALFQHPLLVDYHIWVYARLIHHTTGILAVARIWMSTAPPNFPQQTFPQNNI